MGDIAIGADARCRANCSMALEPAFMLHLETYYAEAHRLTSVDEWAAFEQKWLDPAGWPQRQRPAERSIDLNQRLDGRGWMPTFWSYDLTAEARYHYFAVVLGVAAAVRLPHLRPPIDKAGQQDKHWAQHCAYCEISTHEIGDRHCPVCNRSLFYEYIEG